MGEVASASQHAALAHGLPVGMAGAFGHQLGRTGFGQWASVLYRSQPMQLRLQAANGERESDAPCEVRSFVGVLVLRDGCKNR